MKFGMELDSVNTPVGKRVLEIDPTNWLNGGHKHFLEIN